MSDDRLVADLDAFIAKHRRCGDLSTGMMETEPPRVWITCTCGATIEREWAHWKREGRAWFVTPFYREGPLANRLQRFARNAHVQLKSTFLGSKVNRFTVNRGLALKPSGCVVCPLLDPKTLELGPLWWFGGPPGTPLPKLEDYPIAKHTKANAMGVKLLRPFHHSVPRSAFERVATIPDLAVKLVGQGAKFPDADRLHAEHAGLGECDAWICSCGNEAHLAVAAGAVARATP